MIERVSHITVFVLDQDEAKEFYVDKLGFGVAADQELGDSRWLTVVPPDQPDLFIALVEPKPPEFDLDTSRQIRALVEKGVLGGAFFETTDCHEAYRELSGRGVEFVVPPTERDYGIEATFRDNSGNVFSLLQT